jgi:hypothetical protein
MTSFNDREKAFEDKYKHDQELQFRVVNRRNKLLGLWVAAQLGKAGADADAYAKEVVMSDFEAPGDDDVVRKILADFAAAGVEISEHRVRKHMGELLVTAKDQVMKE